MSNKRRSEPGDYLVGFAKPPEGRRFKPGVSGNPKGRPKGSLNVRTVIQRTLRELIVINEGGRRRTITKLEATAKQLANKAISGDLRAASLVLEHALAAEEQSEQRMPEKTMLGEADQKVMQEMLKRFAPSIDRSPHDENDQ